MERQGPLAGNYGIYVGGSRETRVRRRRHPLLRFLVGSRVTLGTLLAAWVLMWLPLPPLLEGIGYALLGLLILLWFAWPYLRWRYRSQQAVRVVSRAAGRPVKPVR
jgi:hypothetical protein